MGMRELDEKGVNRKIIFSGRPDDVLRKKGTEVYYVIRPGLSQGNESSLTNHMFTI